MSAPQEAVFRPRRVLAVDLDTGRVEYPDPERPAEHLPARVLVRWLGQPVGMVEVEGDDRAVVKAATEEAWQRFRSELEAVAEVRGVPAPAAPEDLTTAGVPALPEPPEPRPLVTVTIASFRSTDSTIATTRRVLAGSWTPLEVVVVDNDADGGPLDAAFTAAFGGDPRVRWVHEPRQGLSFARNAGLAAARGQIVVFTDDDVLVDEQWVEKLVAGFDSPEPVACVTGAILPAAAVFVAVKERVARHPLPEKLRLPLHRAAGCTMGAYLIHPLVKMVLQNQLHFPFESLPQWAGLPLRAALVYVLALALTFVLKKLPGVGKLMG